MKKKTQAPVSVLQVGSGCWKTRCRQRDVVKSLNIDLDLDVDEDSRSRSRSIFFTSMCGTRLNDIAARRLLLH